MPTPIIGPGDITQYQSNQLLVSSNDRIQLNINEGPLKTEQGSIYILYDADKSYFGTDKLTIIKFPENIAFNPQGMFIFNKTLLFVINHAYERGGERIEVLKLVENPTLKLYYQYSILFDNSYNGILNALIVLENKKLLVTTSLPVPDNTKGRPFNTALDLLQTYTMQLLGIPKTYVLNCDYQPNQFATCVKVDDTEDAQNVGIAWDEISTILVSKKLDRTVEVYQLQQNAPKNQILKYIQKVPLNGHPNYIQYDKENKKFYTGINGRMFDIINFERAAKQYKSIPDNTEDWSGVEKIEYKGGVFQSETIFISNSSIKACSSAFLLKNNLFLGSWADKSLVVCNSKKSQQNPKVQQMQTQQYLFNVQQLPHNEL